MLSKKPFLIGSTALVLSAWWTPAVSAQAAPADAVQTSVVAPDTTVLDTVEAATAPEIATQEEGGIVVTGSFIRGTGETSAVPVNVISTDDLRKQGSPTVVELLKSIPAISGVIGDSNQFNPSGAVNEGQATVNLRGLSPQRTLVLLDGKRMPTFSGFVDANIMPIAALGRIELLKDGAAATYGSDAVAGVVNFITRSNVRGLELSGDYRYVPGSDGDINANALWGWQGAGIDLILAGSLQYRSDLPITERDWAIRSYNENPQGGWSAAANPTRFTPLNGFTANGGTVIDPGCTALGGVLTNPTTAGGYGVCRQQYTGWDNLVDRNFRAQIFGKAEAELVPGVTVRVTGLYANTNTPSANRTPSFSVARGTPATVLPANATGLDRATSPATYPGLYVPVSNPGFAALIAANPGLVPAGTTAALIPTGSFRPFFAGGNPLFDYDTNRTAMKREAFRLTAELEGTIADNALSTDTTWTIGTTFGRYDSTIASRETLTARLQLALRGLGGPDCNYVTGTPGAGGCSYFNPFSNALPGDPINGTTNPGYVAAVENTDKALIDWFMPRFASNSRSEILNFDAGLSGATRIALPGGTIKWAVGGQVRRFELSTSYEGFADARLFPCADTPVNGNVTCFPTPTSPFASEPTNVPIDLGQTIYAVYGELNIPVFDAFNVNVAARYEDYGQFGGSTFNPQVRSKLQILPWLAVRGSIGTTFRAPPIQSVANISTLGSVIAFGQIYPSEIGGNPDLGPEKATSYSVGAIVEAGGFRASVDYWNYKLRDVLASEPVASVLAASFPAAGGACIGDPAFIAAHFTFSSGCNSANITRVITRQINGPEINTSGFDIIANYTWQDVFDGVNATIGGTATYVDRYAVGPLIVGGIESPNSAFEATGRLNQLTVAFPLPQWKAQGYLEVSNDVHNARLTGYFIDSYIDERAGLFGYSAAQQTASIAACAGGVVSPECGTVTDGSKIGSQLLFDFAYRVRLPWDSAVTLAVTNIFDRDPPFARLELNYDPLTGNPIGRTFKVGFETKF